MLLAKNRLFAPVFARIGPEIQQMMRAARDFFAAHAHYGTTRGVTEARLIFPKIVRMSHDKHER